MAVLGREKIINAIGETGFPLELRVSDLFNSRGYHVANSIFYVDKDEAKGREIDVRALGNRLREVNGKRYFVRHCFLIECKRYKKRPWVIFSNESNSYDPGLVIGGVSSGMWQLDLPDLLSRVHPFFKRKRLGRGFTELFKEGVSDFESGIFGAIATAAKATHATYEAKFASGQNSICLYYPLVVLDGSLWEAFLLDNAIEAVEEDFVVVSFLYQSPEYKQQGFRVPIVLESALPRLMYELDLALDSISEYFFSDMSKFSK